MHLEFMSDERTAEAHTLSLQCTEGKQNRGGGAGPLVEMSSKYETELLTHLKVPMSTPLGR